MKHAKLETEYSNFALRICRNFGRPSRCWEKDADVDFRQTLLVTRPVRPTRSVSNSWLTGICSRKVYSADVVAVWVLRKDVSVTAVASLQNKRLVIRHGCVCAPGPVAGIPDGCPVAMFHPLRWVVDMRRMVVGRKKMGGWQRKWSTRGCCRDLDGDAEGSWKERGNGWILVHVT
jgi:hypothetical protein